MATAKRAAMTADVLRMLAHLNPRLWPLVEPRVPPHPVHEMVMGVRAAEAGEVGLNPQPLPPLQQDALWHAVRDMSVAVAEATIAASLAGRKPAEVVREVGDDICPEPPKMPWPKKWPVPPQLQQRLLVDPQHVSPAVQATAALVFQSYAQRTTDKPLSTAFTDLADRLLERALKTANHSA
ncbi:hypothetical protein J7F01_03270 [Streptomyces sp. ISL-22]|uniref:Uncharacterized protein n=1 Tax=Streptomyces curacoi TaxID=146536 RepID=A0A124H0K4_9ACTN|nr:MULTISPECIES: hypothetical protein [Streptomyces]KUM74175.1 hypothetical protein AQI70_19810 [Streptomyces curacoi]MBT2419144.1 hypothetical protein [Streptomyces sp. ISL-24]MBT2431239.1 hypothetical protein [Streptomyces sp. ISL-22]